MSLCGYLVYTVLNSQQMLDFPSCSEATVVRYVCLTHCV